MSDKIKTPQERYRDRNREKWNEYERERAKQKYQTDEEYRKKKRQDSLNYYHKLKDEGKTENLQRYKDTFKEKHPDYHTEYNKQYNKPYYAENKERILKMVGEKMMCEYCNKAVRKDYVHKHVRTPKHTKNVKDYEEKLNEFIEQNE